MARPVNETAREWVRELVLREGVRRTGRRLKLADATIARIVAGIDVQESTATVVESKHAGAKAAA